MQNRFASAKLHNDDVHVVDHADACANVDIADFVAANNDYAVVDYVDINAGADTYWDGAVPANDSGSFTYA